MVTPEVTTTRNVATPQRGRRALPFWGIQEAWRPNGRPSIGVQRGLTLVTFLLFIGAWSMHTGFMPRPEEVLDAFSDLFRQGLVYQLYVSMTTNVEAIVISCALTLPLAYLTVLPFMRPLVHAICKARFLGLTGFVVLFTVAFGGGHALKVAILVFGMGVFLITSMNEVVENIAREEYDHARTLGMKPWGVVFEVVIVGQFDAMLDTIRQNAAMGLVMLTMVEGLVRSEGGLGAMMLAEDKHLKLAAVAALQITVLLLGFAQDWLLLTVRRVLCPYASLALERR